MNQTNLKNPARISLAAMAVLCIGALVFYRERLFADTSFSAFNIINNKNFYIENQRYGSFIPQLLPYIGTQLHLSLKIILIGYVLSSNLFYLLIAALLVYRYRQYGLAVCMGLYTNKPGNHPGRFFEEISTWIFLGCLVIFFQ